MTITQPPYQPVDHPYLDGSSIGRPNGLGNGATLLPSFPFSAALMEAAAAAAANTRKTSYSSNDSSSNGTTINLRRQHSSSNAGQTVKFVNSTPEVVESQLAKAGQSKKKRCRTTEDQLRILQRAFAADPMPNAHGRLLLAKRLGMSARAVQVWFQNRRAKEKQDARRQQQGEEGKSSASSSSSGKQGVEQAITLSTPAFAECNTEGTSINALLEPSAVDESALSTAVHSMTSLSPAVSQWRRPRRPDSPKPVPSTTMQQPLVMQFPVDYPLDFAAYTAATSAASPFLYHHLDYTALGDYHQQPVMTSPVIPYDPEEWPYTPTSVYYDYASVLGVGATAGEDDGNDFMMPVYSGNFAEEAQLLAPSSANLQASMLSSLGASFSAIPPNPSTATSIRSSSSSKKSSKRRREAMANISVSITSNSTNGSNAEPSYYYNDPLLGAAGSTSPLDLSLANHSHHITHHGNSALMLLSPPHSMPASGHCGFDDPIDADRVGAEMDAALRAVLDAEMTTTAALGHHHHGLLTGVVGEGGGMMLGSLYSTAVSN